jgi:hypothetical protein
VMAVVRKYDEESLSVALKVFGCRRKYDATNDLDTWSFEGRHFGNPNPIRLPS